VQTANPELLQHDRAVLPGCTGSALEKESSSTASNRNARKRISTASNRAQQGKLVIVFYTSSFLLSCLLSGLAEFSVIFSFLFINFVSVSHLVEPQCLINEWSARSSHGLV
jgi:hypothetical protein